MSPSSLLGYQKRRKRRSRTATNFPEPRLNAAKAIASMVRELGRSERFQQTPGRVYALNLRKSIRAIGTQRLLAAYRAKWGIGSRTLASGAATERFRPSRALAALIAKYSAAAVRGVGAELRQMQESVECDISAYGVEDPAERIGEEIEAILTDLARRTAASGNRTLSLGTVDRLSDDVCTELIWGLRLDPYDPREILDQLHRELRSFVQPHRQRPWGQVTCAPGGPIQLRVDRALTGKVPRLDEVDPDRWNVTE